MRRNPSGAVIVFHQTGTETRAPSSVAAVMTVATSSAACHEGTDTAMASIPSARRAFSVSDLRRQRLVLALVSMCDIGRRALVCLAFLGRAVDAAQHVADRTRADG